MPFGAGAESSGPKEPCIKWGSSSDESIRRHEGREVGVAAFRQKFFDHYIIIFIIISTIIISKFQRSKIVQHQLIHSNSLDLEGCMSLTNREARSTWPLTVASWHGLCPSTLYSRHASLESGRSSNLSVSCRSAYLAARCSSVGVSQSNLSTQRHRNHGNHKKAVLGVDSCVWCA